MQWFSEPPWEGARNAADLGGLPLVGGGVTASGRVWRSAAPEWMTSAGWRAARSAGLTTVIDLRNDAERGRRLEHPQVDESATAGVSVVPTPTEDPNDADFLAECGPWLDHPRSWAANLRRFPGLMAQVFQAVDSAPGSVLLHCAGGRDRTGMVSSMLLSLTGVEPDAITANYAHGFRGAGAHRGHGLCWDAQASAWVTNAREAWSAADLDEALADRLPVLLDWLETADIASYLRQSGLDNSQVTRLRVRLR